MKATGLFFASSDYYTHQKIKHYTFHAVFFHFTDKKDIYLRKISCKGRHIDHTMQHFKLARVEDLYYICGYL